MDGSDSESKSESEFVNERGEGIGQWDWILEDISIIDYCEDIYIDIDIIDACFGISRKRFDILLTSNSSSYSI